MSDTSESQALDPIEQTNRIVELSAQRAVAAIAAQQIAQSMVIAVQSSVDHLQSAYTLNVATTAGVFARAIEDPAQAKELQAVLQASQATVNAALDNLSRIVTEARRATGERSPESAEG